MDPQYKIPQSVISSAIQNPVCGEKMPEVAQRIEHLIMEISEARFRLDAIASKISPILSRAERQFDPVNIELKSTTALGESIEKATNELREINGFMSYIISKIEL